MAENFLFTCQQSLRAAILRHPRAYLVFLSALAAAGYVFTFLFPALIVWCVGYLVYHYPYVHIDENGQTVVACTGILILSVTLLYRMLTITPSQPEGLRLQDNIAPVLPPEIPDGLFDRIIIDYNDGVDIIETPCHGIPLKKYRTLRIGMPTLLFFDADHFQHLLKRTLLQFRGGDCLWINWLKQCEHFWQSYATAYKADSGLDWEIPYLFFKYYARLFSACAHWLPMLEVLQADRCALTEINDQELLETVEYSYLLSSFLSRSFWPRIDKVQRFIPLNEVRPAQEMLRETRKIRRNSANFRWLDDNADEIEIHQKHLSLHQRIANIGHDRIKVPAISGNSAFEHFFPVDMQQRIATFMDTLWLKDKLHTAPKPAIRQGMRRWLRMPSY